MVHNGCVLRNHDFSVTTGNNNLKFGIKFSCKM